MFRFLQRGRTARPQVPQQRPKQRPRRLLIDELEARRVLVGDVSMPVQPLFIEVGQTIVAVGEAAPSSGEVQFSWTIWRDNEATGDIGGWDAADESVYLEGFTPASLDIIPPGYEETVGRVSDSFEFTIPSDFAPGTYFIAFEAVDDGPALLMEPVTFLVDPSTTENFTVNFIPDTDNTQALGSVFAATAEHTGNIVSPVYQWTIVDSNSVVVHSQTGPELEFVPLNAGVYNVTLELSEQGDPEVKATITATLPIVNGTVSASGELSLTTNPNGNSLVVTLTPDGLISVNGGTPVSYSDVNTISIIGQSGDDNITVQGNLGVPITINGGGGNDTILITAPPPAPMLFSLLSTTSSGGNSSITIDAGAGNDTVKVDASITSSVIVYGGAGDDVIIGGGGNDLLFGGTGSNVLVGGGGNDILTSGGQRDILIGGLGSDLLISGSQDDILIAGYTDYDSDVEALSYLLGEWLATTSFTTRITSLKTVSSSHPYLNNTTVHDDNALDILFGLGGTDWFMINRSGGGAKDITLDANGTEIAKHLEL